MRCIHVLLDCLILGTIIILSCTYGPDESAWAYEVWNFNGGAICQENSQNTIQLDLMRVIIRLKKKSYEVDSTFHLFNTGDTITEPVGSPRHGSTTNIDDFFGKGPPGGLVDLTRFKTWIDSLKADFVWEPNFLKGRLRFFAIKPDWGHYVYMMRREETTWMVRKVTFPGHTRTVIRTLYEIPEENYGSYYLYGVARYWKGNIGKAVFILDNNYTQRRGTKASWNHIVSSPNTFLTRLTKAVQILTKVDFEPKFNDYLSFHRTENKIRATELGNTYQQVE
jgi:hypothetical protein